MTVQDAHNLLSILTAAYPASFRQLDRGDAIAAVKLWALIFSDESYETVSTAVYYRIATVKDSFPPTPGEIRSLIDRLRNPDAETASQAWASVRKALSNSLYGSAEEFEKLSPAAKLAVGSAERLRQMAMDGSFSESVEESHFLRAYENCSRRLNEIRRIPAILQPTLEKLAKGMALEPAEGNKPAIPPRAAGNGIQ